MKPEIQLWQRTSLTCKNWLTASLDSMCFEYHVKKNQSGCTCPISIYPNSRTRLSTGQDIFHSSYWEVRQDYGQGRTKLDGWDPILQKDMMLPTNPAMARIVKHHQVWYCLINGLLYCKLSNQLLLICLKPHEAKMVLTKVHESIYGEHIDRWTLAFKVFR